MYKLNARIKIESEKTWFFDKITEVTLLKNQGELSDIATLTIPKKTTWEDAQVCPLKVGDKVTIQLGYDDVLVTRFIGYIKKIGTKTPIKIELQDSMYLLSTYKVKAQTIKKGDIKTILSTILPSTISCKVLGAQALGNYRINYPTAIEVLNDLRKNGVKAFFKIENEQPILYCGVLSAKDSAPKPVFRYGFNVIKNDTQYTKGSERKIKIKAISCMANGKRVTVEEGDSTGEERTLYTYGLSDWELREWAKQKLQNLKRDGMTGTFTTFGIPEVDKGDVVYLALDKNSQEECYVVNSVEVTYNTAGYRQVLTIDTKL